MTGINLKFAYNPNMNRFVFTTLILLAATVLVTVAYFKNLKQPGQETTFVISDIPNSAPLVLEIGNDGGFYDILSNNKLFLNVAGQQKINELNNLRRKLLLNPSLKSYFADQPVFISLHPNGSNAFDLLISVASNKKIEKEAFDQLKTDSVTLKPIDINKKQGFELDIKGTDRPFYLINTEDDIYQGSFSLPLIDQCAHIDTKRHKPSFIQLSNQQNNDALAVLYVNNINLQPLLAQCFKDSKPDLFRPFCLLQAESALSMNYNTDALMFSGVTKLNENASESYLNLFANQHPVVNTIENILPSTTAYSTTFSISDPTKFTSDLADFQKKAGLTEEIRKTFEQIRTETGINLKSEFNPLLGSEFCVVTTRFQEKLGIVEIKDGSSLRPFMVNISTMSTDDIGQFNYSKIPYYLLGDVFSVFRKPYFTIINNYLILANSASELRSYQDSYNNQKFLSKTETFNTLDELQAEKENVSFFIHFKNAQPVFKQTMKPAFYQAFEKNNPGLKNYYGAAYQLISSDHNFYTNYCMRLNKVDTIQNNN